MSAAAVLPPRIAPGFPYGRTAPGGLRNVGEVTADGELFTVYEETMRGAPSVPGPGTVYEEDGPLVRAVGGFRGFVFGPPDTGGLRGPALDRLIARQRDRFAARGEAVEWRVHEHDEPRELTERLRAAGFVPGARLAVLVCASSKAAAAAAGPAPEGVVLRRVTEARDMRRITAMQAAVWDGDFGWLARMLTARAAADPENAVVLVAEDEGEVVSAGWMFAWPDRGFAGLRGGTTLPRWRGRGLYRALVAERARRAMTLGARYLQVDASPDSRPVLCRLGFTAVTSVTQYIWTPPAPTGR